MIYCGIRETDMSLATIHTEGLKGDYDPVTTRAHIEMAAVYNALRAAREERQKRLTAGEEIGPLTAAQIIAIDQYVTNNMSFNPETAATQLTS